MSNALNEINVRQTSQRQRTPGRTDEVRNNAGGYVFKVDDKNRLERFLILGTDGGTYYVSQADLTKQNFDFLLNMVQANARNVVDTVVAVSDSGRAVRNSAALFAMAVALTFCADADKAYVRQNVAKVARTATHLFEFAQYIENLGGWGRAKRGAVADWYESKSADDLGYQLIKYRQRNGWSHRDLLRLSHAKPESALANFALNKEYAVAEAPAIVRGYELISRAETVKEVLEALTVYKNLPWEAIPTQFLKETEVWKQLFANGQLRGQALLRNVTRLARLGAFDDMVFAREYADKLTDAEMIAKTRLHPINFLNASVVYNDGQIQRGEFSWYGGSRRQKNWTTVPVIADALDAGFHTAFKTVEPAGKRTLLGIDVSGSMACEANGLDLSAAQVAAAIAMTVARTEPYYRAMGFSTSFVDLGITPKQSLQTILRNTAGRTFGGTDASLPMVWALQQKIAVDTFVVITDNETWAGRMKPSQALQRYRDQMGIPARLAVLGVSATDFTIADPKDRGMMDFVGFDSNAPKVLADFSAGRI